MSKRVFRYILAGALVVFFLPAFSPIVPQNSGWKNWTWKRYKIKFKLPSNWRVTKNNSKAFIARGPSASMKIKAYRSRSHASALKEARTALSTFRILREKRVIGQRALDKGNSGLNRYLMFGKAKYNGRGSYNGKPVRFGIVGLINPNNTTTMYVRLWWFEGKSSTRKNNNDSHKIVHSFKAY